MTAKNIALACALFLLGAGAGAARADMPPPSGVVNLTASASTDVPKDVMSVLLTTTRNGPDANAVQSALKQALDAALSEARRVAKPGQVDVQTGNFSLFPRYGTKGEMAGWQGTVEMMVEGRDMAGIGQLVGRISTLTLSRVGYGISRELREKTESDVAAQAVSRYRAKAGELAKLFGYSGYTLREVNVGGSEPPPTGIVPMMRAAAAAPLRDDAPLPIEAGKATVSVSVNGTVQLTR